MKKVKGRYYVRGEWVELEADRVAVERLRKELGVSRLMASLLFNRGLKTPEEARVFLRADSTLLHDPFLMKNMNEAVDLLLKFRDSSSTITIFGDYDVDGITGTVVLYTFLKKYGWKVNYYIPDRMDEGYGLNMEALTEILSSGSRVIVTVDCGITSIEEVKYAKKHGVSVIITDHHEPHAVIPKAEAVVNPKRFDDEYPFKDLAGVGVAYKLVNAIGKRLGIDRTTLEKEYLSYVAIGTIADIVPLVGENRYLVKRGLEYLAQTENLGLKTLMKFSGINSLLSSDIAFKIAPKLNAAGRMHKATLAIELLLAKDEEKAVSLAQELLKHNAQRQEVELTIYEEAQKKIERDESIRNAKVIVVEGERWHPGVIGIVASRLVNVYNRPIVMLSIDGKEARGSARSVEGINIMDLLSKVSHLLEEFGGHSYAAGVSLPASKIGEFRKCINEAYEEKYGEFLYVPKIKIDACIGFEALKEEFLKELEALRPFGHGNPEPIFAFENLHVKSLKFTKNNEHVKLLLSDNLKVMPAIGFNLADSFKDYLWVDDGIKVDVAAKVKLEEHNGVKHVILNVEDIKFKVDENYIEDVKDRRFMFELLKNPGLAHDESFKPDITQIAPRLLQTFSTRLGFKLDEDDLEETGFFHGDAKSRNAFMALVAMKELSRGNKIVVVSASNLLSSATMWALQHYLPNVKCEYVNSLTQPRGAQIVYVTMPAFLKNHRFFRDYSLLILDKPELLVMVPNVAEKFIDLLKKDNPWKVKAVVGDHNDFVDEILKILNCRRKLVLQTRYSMVTGIVDERDRFGGGPQIIEFIKRRERTSIVMANSKSVMKLVGKLKVHVSSPIFRNLNFIFYHHMLKQGQKFRIFQLVEKDKIDLLVTTPNNDGLSSLNGKANVIFYGPPKSVFELVDAVSTWFPEFETPLLYLAYSSDEIRKTRKQLEKLFPTTSRIRELLEETNYLIPEEILRNSSEMRITVKMLDELGKISRKNGIYKVHPFHLEELERSTRWYEGMYDLQLNMEMIKLHFDGSVRKLLNVINHYGGVHSS